MAFNASSVAPRDAGTGTNGTVDLGASSARFKDLYLSGGVYLGGTGSANKLDDYEVGTFTPIVFGSTTTGAATYTIQSGRYTKVGNKVFIEIVLGWSAHTGAGALRINGLPFTCNGTRQTFSILAENLTYTGELKALSATGSSNDLWLFNQSSASGLSIVNLDTNVSYMVITGGYITNS